MNLSALLMAARALGAVEILKRKRAAKPRSAAQTAAAKRAGQARDQAVVSEEEKAAAAPKRQRKPKSEGSVTQYRGRDTLLTTVNPAQVGTDAVAFQYKGNADGRGVTDRLEGVRSWDATRAGVLLVHERADGSRVVIDGHQRTGLARRLEAEGGKPVASPAIVFRERDGWTDVKELRAIAAAKNIAEGSGDMLDAARVFRDAPSVADDANLPPNSALVRGARGLAALSEDAWGAVLNRVHKPEHGAIVGAMAKDRPDAHGAILDAIKAADPKSAREAAQIARETLDAGFNSRNEASLFGTETRTTALIADRANITQSALKSLKRDAAALMTAARRADVLEGRADNVIDTDATGKAGEADRQLASIMTRVVSQRGTHAWQIVQDAAQDVASMRMTRRAASARVAKELRTAFEAAGLRGLTDGPPEGGFAVRERRRRRAEPNLLTKARARARVRTAAQSAAAARIGRARDQAVLSKKEMREAAVRNIRARLRTMREDLDEGRVRIRALDDAYRLGIASQGTRERGRTEALNGLMKAQSAAERDVAAALTDWSPRSLGRFLAARGQTVYDGSTAEDLRMDVARMVVRRARGKHYMSGPKMRVAMTKCGALAAAAHRAIAKAKRSARRKREASPAKADVAAKRERYPRGHPKAGQFMPGAADAPKVRASKPKATAPPKPPADPMGVPDVRQRIEDYAGTLHARMPELRRREAAWKATATKVTEARAAEDAADLRVRRADTALGRAQKAAKSAPEDRQARITLKRAQTIASKALSQREEARAASAATQREAKAATEALRSQADILRAYRDTAARALHRHAGRRNRYDYPGEWQQSLAELDRLVRSRPGPARGMGA